MRNHTQFVGVCTAVVYTLRVAHTRFVKLPFHATRPIQNTHTMLTLCTHDAHIFLSVRPSPSVSPCLSVSPSPCIRLCPHISTHLTPGLSACGLSFSVRPSRPSPAPSPCTMRDPTYTHRWSTYFPIASRHCVRFADLLLAALRSVPSLVSKSMSSSNLSGT